jgi:four helix bundle protein
MWGESGAFVKDFKDLTVWRKAHTITLRAYRLTQSFPREELFGLTSQIRRSAASIGANIAEGCGRRSDGEMTRFLHIARGSAVELEYHLILAHDLALLTASSFKVLAGDVDEVQRMLTSLIQRVKPIEPVRLKSKRAEIRSGLEAHGS